MTAAISISLSILKWEEKFHSQKVWQIVKVRENRKDMSSGGSVHVRHSAASHCSDQIYRQNWDLLDEENIYLQVQRKVQSIPFFDSPRKCKVRSPRFGDILIQEASYIRKCLMTFTAKVWAISRANAWYWFWPGLCDTARILFCLTNIVPFYAWQCIFVQGDHPIKLRSAWDF